MSKIRRRANVIVVAPGLDSQGGIATVVENFGKTSFWTDFGCCAYASTAVHDSRWSKALDDVRRWGIFSCTLVTKDKPWVVSIHTAHDASFYRKLSYLIICAIFRVPAVLHVHPAGFAGFYQNGGVFRRLAIRTAGRIADQIVVLSCTIRELLSTVFPPSKVQVLNNPIDIRNFSIDPAPRKTIRPRVLFLGWIIREKGVYDLADAIPSVLSEFPDALFTIAGNKEVLKLKEQLARRGLENSTEVLGWVDGQQKIDLLRTSWTLVLPSYTEGVPNVILEAMASRLPIVTTPVGGIPDVLQDEQTALFIEPGDVAAIADALKRLLRDSDLREALASAAFQRACDYYSLERANRGLRRIYDRYRSGPASH